MVLNQVAMGALYLITLIMALFSNENDGQIPENGGFRQELTSDSHPHSILKQNVALVDKFVVPVESLKVFKSKMAENRNFVKELPGYISGDAFEHKAPNGYVTILTIAVWESEEKLSDARQQIMAKFKREGFAPSAFYAELGVKAERALYFSIM